MPRKVRLTPLHRDLIWLLEEAGEETVATIRAILKPADPAALEAATAALAQLGYVRRSENAGHPSLVLTADGRRALTA